MTGINTTEYSKNEMPRSRGVFATLGRMFKLAFGAVALAIIVGAGFLIGGFLKFTDTITSYDLEVDPEKSAAIVVYTGGTSRIEEAARLLQEGKGKRLLISGVNPKTSKKVLLERSGLEPALFDCCVDIDKEAPDTHGNAVETSKWNAVHKFDSLIIVTSNYHMPRSMLETNRRLPEVKLVAYPVATHNFDKDGWYKDRKILRLLLSEYTKYVAAQFRPVLTGKTIKTIRASLTGL